MFLPMRLELWRDTDRYGDGYGGRSEQLEQFMEAVERNRGSTGETMSRFCMSYAWSREVDEQRMEQVYLPMNLPMKREAGEIMGGDRGGWEQLGRCTEAAGHHGSGGGECMTRVGVLVVMAVDSDPRTPPALLSFFLRLVTTSHIQFLFGCL